MEYSTGLTKLWVCVKLKMCFSHLGTVKDNIQFRSWYI